MARTDCCAIQSSILMTSNRASRPIFINGISLFFTLLYIHHLDFPIYSANSMVLIYLLGWDRALIHRSRLVQRFVDRNKKIELSYFPAYAPELNPVEILWAYLKKNPLANYAPATLTALSLKARYHSTRLRRRPDLLRAFLRATPLFSHK